MANRQRNQHEGLRSPAAFKQLQVQPSYLARVESVLTGYVDELLAKHVKLSDGLEYVVSRPPHGLVYVDVYGGLIVPTAVNTMADDVLRFLGKYYSLCELYVGEQEEKARNDDIKNDAWFFVGCNFAMARNTKHGFSVSTITGTQLNKAAGEFGPTWLIWMPRRAMTDPNNTGRFKHR